MQPAGWVFMLSSVGAVVALVSYCYYRLLTLPKDDAHRVAHKEEQP